MLDTIQDLVALNLVTILQRPFFQFTTYIKSFDLVTKSRLHCIEVIESSTINTCFFIQHKKEVKTKNSALYCLVHSPALYCSY